jgi:hypothetical protein
MEIVDGRAEDQQRHPDRFTPGIKDQREKNQHRIADFAFSL